MGFKINWKKEIREVFVLKKYLEIYSKSQLVPIVLNQYIYFKTLGINLIFFCYKNIEAIRKIIDYKNLGGKMDNINLDEPVEISADTWWVGGRKGNLLERNIYLRVFKGGGKIVNLLIDPGPPEDLKVLMEKVSKVIGSIKNVNLIFVNHQDPDVGYNSSSIQKLNPNCLILSSEDSWRLINFYGLDFKKFKNVESFKNNGVILSTGHKLIFVPTPFCHFRGAVMVYDPETRILFSGDLFGGLSYAEDFYAKENSWDGIKAFHQIYMPTKEALKYAIENIKNLNPEPQIIAPQHGGIIKGELLKDFMERLENTEVGLDLYLRSKMKENYIFALNDLIEEIKPYVEEKSLNKILESFKDVSFTSIFSFDKDGIKDIKVDGNSAAEFLINNLKILFDEKFLDFLDISIVKVFTKWNIPMPKTLGSDSKLEVELFEVV